MSDDFRRWTRLARRQPVEETERIRLDARGRRYRYYLVWIVGLPEPHQANIMELSLFR